VSLVRRLRGWLRGPLNALTELLNALTDPLPAPPPPFARLDDRPPAALVLLSVDGTTEPVRVLLRDGRLIVGPSVTHLPSHHVTATYDLSLDPDTAESLAGALLHAVDCPDEEAP
jgi:hypothetical protein